MPLSEERGALRRRAGRPLPVLPRPPGAGGERAGRRRAWGLGEPVSAVHVGCGRRGEEGVAAGLRSGEGRGRRNIEKHNASPFVGVRQITFLR